MFAKTYLRMNCSRFQSFRKYSNINYSKNPKILKFRNNTIFLSTIISLGYITYFNFFNKSINEANVHGHEYINTDTIPLIAIKELNIHNKESDCWVSIHGHVYDVTNFLQAHPGGVGKLLKYAGKDATRGFRMQHPETYLVNFLGRDAYKGELIVQEKEKKSKKDKDKDKAKTKSKNKSKNKKENEIQLDDFHVRKIKNDTKEEDDVEQYYKNFVKEHLPKKKKKAKNNNNNNKIIETYNKETKPSIHQIFSLNDFEYVAKKLLPDILYTYIQSGSDNEITRFENRAVFGRIFFRPKCLVNVQNLKLNKKIIGVDSKLPFLIGSFSGSGLIQDEGENIVVKNAVLNDMIYIIPKDSDSSLEDLIKESKGKDVFYQYSIDTVEELKEACINLNKLSETYSNIKAIFIDINNSISSNLEHYKKIEASKHLYENHPAPQLLLKTEKSNFNLCWTDLQKLKDEVQIPIILKGIQRSEDIIKSKELGFKGVLISDHEGKQLDQCQSPIEVLYETRKKFDKDEKFDIFIEGGFRRGSDIVKALCLGGIPVISKPILFSEIYGDEGVKKSIKILEKEVSTTMKLIGAKSVDELNKEFIDCESLKMKVTTIKNFDLMYDDNYTPMPTPKFKNQENLKML